MPLKLFCTLFCLLLFFQIQAQQTFNPDNVLVITKEGSKRPGMMRSGTKVICKLKNAERVKGDILVYSDHILIESKKIQFQEIAMIKLHSWNSWKRQGGGMILGEIRRREIGANALSTASWVQTGLFTVLNFTILEKKYISAKGWEFKVQEFKRPTFTRTD